MCRIHCQFLHHLVPPLPKNHWLLMSKLIFFMQASESVQLSGWAGCVNQLWWSRTEIRWRILCRGHTEHKLSMLLCWLKHQTIILIDCTIHLLAQIRLGYGEGSHHIWKMLVCRAKNLANAKTYGKIILTMFSASFWLSESESEKNLHSKNLDSKIFHLWALAVWYCLHYLKFLC